MGSVEKNRREEKNRTLTLEHERQEANANANDWFTFSRQICVVGAGVTGLTLTAALQRLCPNVEQITLCEGRSDILQPQIGGGLQMTGGASVLHRLGLLNELKLVAQPFQSVRCVNSKENLLYDFQIAEAMKKYPSLYQGSYSIMRDALVSLLHKANRNHPSAGKIQFLQNHSVAGISEEDEGVRVEFSNGQVLSNFDLVVGADGVNSMVRRHLGCKYILGNTIGEHEAYSGLRIAFCVTPPNKDLRKGDDRSFHQYMGDGIYGLVSSYGGLEGIQHVVAVVYKENDVPFHGENIGWALSSREESLSYLRNQLARGGLSDIGEIERVLAEVQKGGRVFDLAVKDRVFPLDHWSSPSGRVVLAGDSAHPMAPFFGQGANQGMQDALAVAKNIVAKSSEKDISELSSRYENNRKLHTSLLVGKSHILGTIETLSGSLGMLGKDTFFKVAGAVGVIEKEFLTAARLEVE
eukprot:scaffold437_cov168-Ochromonas_danica.AAC.12